MSRYIRKCHIRGDMFLSLPTDEPDEDSRELPHFVLALLPLVAVFVLYTVVKLNIALALIIATVFCFLLLFPHFRKNAHKAGKTLGGLLRERITMQTVTAGKILIVVCMLVGFGGVVQSTQVFGQIVTALCSGESALIFLCAVAICVVILVSCNPVAGEAVALNALSPYFIGAGVPAAVFHRLTVIGSTTFDSLPTGIGVIMAHELTGVKMKDGYRPVFIITVLIPLAGTLLMAALYTIFPGVA